MGFDRRKMEDQRRRAAENEVAARRATDAQVLGVASRRGLTPWGHPARRPLSPRHARRRYRNRVSALRRRNFTGVEDPAMSVRYLAVVVGHASSCPIWCASRT